VTRALEIDMSQAQILHRKCGWRLRIGRLRVLNLRPLTSKDLKNGEKNASQGVERDRMVWVYWMMRRKREIERMEKERREVM
jgi:hypothetical protein